MRQAPTYRRILHIDLTPFFVGVERARNPSLHGRALIIGAVCERGRVAGMSEEARAAGVEVGQPTALAQRLCPEAALLPGDLDAYARASDQLTAILTALTPRVERPSTDEALLDLSTAAGTMRRALAVTESVRDVIRQRLGLDCSFGLGGSRRSVEKVVGQCPQAGEERPAFRPTREKDRPHRAPHRAGLATG